MESIFSPASCATRCNKSFSMTQSQSASRSSTQRWDFIELSFHAPPSAGGNPFTSQPFSATFTHLHRGVRVDGFYDGRSSEGQDIYRVRFMPDTLGEWRYDTHSDKAALNGHTGTFTCIAPSEGNHGPVLVRDQFHFAYADGTPHVSVGTTCYAWIHQPDALIAQTLETLKTAPFNKLRMCIFPKHYTYNANEPALFAYERDASGNFDHTRFDPAFFQHLERCVAALRDLNIEADLILFHPYDRWGFAKMDRESNHRYLRYIAARLSAFRNVWWSMANEFDLMPWLPMQEWDDFFRTVQESDPVGHLRSVHNCRGFYDYAKPWVTHCSIQHSAVEQTAEWRDQFRKPVVNDECCYEGNIPNGWGNITAEELVRRFWETTLRGGYCGHGETYLNPGDGRGHDVLWWSKGGVLHGHSAPRITFLRQLIEDLPSPKLDPITHLGPNALPCSGVAGSHYLVYTGYRQPAELPFKLVGDTHYKVDIIDTWNMTITPVAGTFSGEFKLVLPGRPYQAVRLVKA